MNWPMSQDFNEAIQNPELSGDHGTCWRSPPVAVTGGVPCPAAFDCWAGFMPSRALAEIWPSM